MNDKEHYLRIEVVAVDLDARTVKYRVPVEEEEFLRECAQILGQPAMTKVRSQVMHLPPPPAWAKLRKKAQALVDHVDVTRERTTYERELADALNDLAKPAQPESDSDG